MRWHTELRAVRDSLKAAIRDLPASMLVWTLTARSSALGAGDAVKQSDDSSNQRPTTRIQQYGFSGRPENGLRGLSIRFGSSNVIFFGIAPTSKTGPQDLAEGESAVWNKTKALVRLWASGKMSLASDGDDMTLDSGSKDIVLNGGTKKVARVDDTVDMGTLSVTAAVPPANLITIIYTPSGGSPQTLAFGSLGPVSLTGKITSGANHVKG